MKLTTFLSPTNIRQGIELSSKKRALEVIGQIVAEHINQQGNPEQEIETHLCPIECFSCLFKREKLGSTGINQGVALPHAKLPEISNFVLEQPIAVFLQLAKPINYEATDNKDVDLIYAILFSEESCAKYKHCLSEIATKLSDKTLLKQLRSAESIEDIWQTLQRFDEQTEESEDERDGTDHY